MPKISGCIGKQNGMRDNVLNFPGGSTGVRSEKEYGALEHYLISQRFFHPKDPVASYAQAARIYFDCRKKGITVSSTIDCLIAQIALEHELFLLHNDSDFQAMTCCNSSQSILKKNKKYGFCLLTSPTDIVAYSGQSDH